MKRKLIATLAVISLCMSFAGCSNSTTASEAINNTVSASYEEDETIEGVKTSIVLGDTITVDGDGATVENNKVTLTAAGSYEISGTLSDGQIVVNAGAEDNIEIVLNNVDITCSNSAPIYVMNSKNTYLVLGDNTENKITDGESYVLADSTTDEPNAAIFSKDDLVIKGNGSLTVNANYKHGIVSKDDLKIKSGTINVTANGDGLKGKDSVTVVDGNVTINAKGDGIQSSNIEDATKGNIEIKGGNLNITAELDGIQAETNVLISDGDITISSGGGSVNSSKSTTESQDNTWGNWGMKGGMQGGMKPEESQTTTSTDTTPSAKAIKAAGDITIDGGNINIDSSDDAMHSNNSLVINNGTINISSGDDGLHSDSTLDINGGDINITKSYEGIESQTITINGGNTSLVSSDDGLNASGGNDGSAVNGRPGQNGFASSGNGIININGGYIYIDSNGDGIDSNGSVYMKGGVAIVSGPEGSANGALDYDASFEATGGVLIAAGSAGMVQTPSTSSAQNSISVFTNQEANTLIHIESESGEEVVTFAPSKKYGSVVVCSPSLKTGSSYKILTGGSSTGTVKDGLYSDGTYSGGTELSTVTISDKVTQVGASAGGGMMGGNRGDKGNRPNRN